MAREWTDEERRRADEEEEQHFWATREDERREEEERAAAKEATIEEMERWFFEQFEDPQVETPRDSENQRFIYLWGGPFGAGDVLHATFSDEHPEDWISEAEQRIERDGTVEWAPTSTGEFYEHPEPDTDDVERNAASTVQLTASTLERLAALETIVANLSGFPAQLGHNAPPEEIGTPPYTDEDKSQTLGAIAEARSAVEAAEPDPQLLAALSSRFEAWGSKVGLWLAKKGDLAVDELIKNSVRIVTWSKAVAAFGAVAAVLHELANALTGHF